MHPSFPSYIFPELTHVARLDTRKDLNRPVFVSDTVVGGRDGYASLDRAIKELGQFTQGDAHSAVAILIEKGRFVGHTAYAGPHWLTTAGNDFTGQASAARPFDLTTDIKFKRMSDKVMAFVDGDIVVRNEG